MFAIELRARPCVCARLIRGTASSASAVIGRWARSSTSSWSSIGESQLISVAPSLSPSSCDGDGGLTPNTMSADSGSPIVAPASLVRPVGERRQVAGTGLHDHFVPELDQLSDSGWGRGDTGFPVARLLQDPDVHAAPEGTG